MENLIAQVQAIQERNIRVEAEKAWEVSWMRMAMIALLTYVVAAFFLWQLGIPLPFLQALVPSGGYAFSTLSLPWLKRRWMQRYLERRNVRGA